MRALQYFLQRLSLAVVIASISSVNLSHASDDVLVLLRGTAAHPFNQELVQGIVEAKQQAKTPLRFEIQYTGDRLSATYDAGWDSYHRALQGLYNQQEWRAIVVAWPNDLQFALRKFPSSTLVNLSPRIYSGPEQVINLGQEYKERIKRSLEWLKDDHPYLNSLHLIVGSRRVEDPAVQQVIEVSRELGFAPPDLMTSRDPSELSRQVANLGDNQAVIYMPLLVDERGEMLIGRDVLQQLAEVSVAPLLSPLQSYVAAGAIGGYVGDVGGYGAALVEVLQADVPADTLARSVKTSNWVFNQMQMERYGMKLPSASDPRFDGALILNTAPPLFSERGWGVLLTLGFSAAILLFLILIWSRREARAHRTIAALNYSLKQKNVELTDTNQELEDALYEAALQELKASTRTAQLQLAMRLASVTVFEIDYQTLRARRSGETEWRPLLQIVAGGLEDSKQIERILTLNQAPYTNVDVECREPGGENTDHRHAYRLTLSERTENEDGQEVFYMVRQEISAVKDAQQQLQAEAHERKFYQLQVARMMEHLKRFQRENHSLTEIAKRADLDSLTGCLNRRGWERLAEQEFSRLKRQHNSTTSTLLMLDLDYFK